MATDDRQILVVGQEATPAAWLVPGNGQVTPRSVFAHYNGTSAASAFVPALKIVSDGGETVGIYPCATSIVAGASADVSWFPGVSEAGPQQGSGVPPAGALDDYVFKHANTTVTGTGHSSQTNLIIQGNAVTYDGNTRVSVEFFAPIVEILGGDQNQAIGFELWDGADGLGGGTDKGTILYIEGGLQPIGGAPSHWVFGHGAYSKSILTPTAGSHTFSVYAWRNDGSGTCTVFASTFVDGLGNVGPAWYRVTKT